MKMKMILPMMLIAALPLGADAQNKSSIICLPNLSEHIIFRLFSIKTHKHRFCN